MVSTARVTDVLRRNLKLILVVILILIAFSIFLIDRFYSQPSQIAYSTSTFTVGSNDDVHYKITSELAGVKLIENENTQSWIEDVFANLDFDPFGEFLVFSTRNPNFVNPNNVEFIFRPIESLPMEQQDNLLDVITHFQDGVVAGYMAEAVESRSVRYLIYLKYSEKNYPTDNLIKDLTSHLLKTIYRAEPPPRIEKQQFEEYHDSVINSDVFPFKVERTGFLSQNDNLKRLFDFENINLIKEVYAQGSCSGSFECGRTQKECRCDSDSSACTREGADCGVSEPGTCICTEDECTTAGFGTTNCLDPNSATGQCRDTSTYCDSFGGCVYASACVPPAAPTPTPEPGVPTPTPGGGDTECDYHCSGSICVAGGLSPPDSCVSDCSACGSTPDCSLDLIPDNPNISVGDSVTFTANHSGNDMTHITYESSDVNVFPLQESEDPWPPPWQVTGDAIAAGTAIVTAKAKQGATTFCQDSETVTVNSGLSCTTEPGPLPDPLDPFQGPPGGYTYQASTTTSDASRPVNRVVYYTDPNVPGDSIYFSPEPYDTGTGSISTTLYTGPPALPGAETIYTQGYIMDGGVELAACPLGSTASSEVSNPPPWWLVFGGSIYATGPGPSEGVIRSDIPVTATLSYLLDDLTRPFGGDMFVEHGIAISGNNESAIQNPVSPSNAKVGGHPRTPVINLQYNYDYFLNRAQNYSTIPSTVTLNNLKGCNTFEGFKVCRSGGDLTITGGAGTDLGDERIVVLGGGHVFIDTNINLNDGRGFFMVIAYHDIRFTSNVGTDITDPTIIDPDREPDMEGVFYAQDDIWTAYDPWAPDREDNIREVTKQMKLRGLLVALNATSPSHGMTMQRSLPDNASYPAEVFEFAPDQILRFPVFFGVAHLEWREVAP